jgi:hypothetical protein
VSATITPIPGSPNWYRVEFCSHGRLVDVYEVRGRRGAERLAELETADGITEETDR